MTSDPLTLFSQARALAPADRLAFLDRACAGDPALRDRVAAMLRADDRPHDVLDRTPEELAEEFEPPRVTVRAGRRVGPYRIVRELGRGGMGVVYLAERDDVAMRVALKLITANVASAEGIARFHYERRILASLEHPHIARFLDAGIAEDETPWFAMEYVEGEPIDAWCDARRLGLPGRVQLFTKVADAVAYVHRNLLVHRDLKPGNILVSAAGEPKLVDFGIAKLLADEVEGRRTVPSASYRPLTPEFASPEQLTGARITPASDVYQLGLVFHELLTGRRAAGPGGRPLDYFGRVADMEPVPASTRVKDPPRPARAGEPARSAAVLAELRRASPARLKRQLAGDLDNILRVALHPVPARRYPTAQHLADELRRHAEGMPLAARPRSLRYRAAKFVGRHKLAAALVLLLDLVLVGSVVVVAGQARRIARERDRAQELSGVLEGLLRYADPTTGRRDSLALVAALGDATARARAGVARDPELWGRTLVVLGAVYRNRGQPDSAAALWREAVAALEPAVPPDHPVLLDALGWLGTSQVEQGDMRAGLALLERALTHARRLDAPRRAEVAASLINLGFGRQVAGDDAGARTLYREALAVLETLPDSGAAEAAAGDYERALINLGFLALRRGENADAEASFRVAYQRRLARWGEESGPTLNAMTALARALLRLERVDQAAALSRKGLEIRRRLHPEPHLNLAEGLELHAQVLAAQGRLAAAEAHARQALATYRAASGERTLHAAYALAGLGAVLARQERHPESAAVRRQSLALYRELAGTRHPAALQAAVSLAESEVRLGRPAAAESLLREAIAGLDSLGRDAPALAQPSALLGEILAKSGRCLEARPHLTRAAELARTQWPETHPSVEGPRLLLKSCA